MKAMLGTFILGIVFGFFLVLAITPNGSDKGIVDLQSTLQDVQQRVAREVLETGALRLWAVHYRGEVYAVNDSSLTLRQEGGEPVILETTKDTLFYPATPPGEERRFTANDVTRGERISGTIFIREGRARVHIVEPAGSL